MTLKQLLHKITSILIMLLVLSTFLVNPAPASAAPLAPASQGLAVADLIKPDGSLDTSAASGSLNLAGWNINLDPSRGPVFSPSATASQYAWSTLGSGVHDDEVDVITISGTDLYVGGGFTSVTGCTGCNRIAKWSTTTNSWSALGSGIGKGYVLAIAVSTAGDVVYAGGNFDSVTGCIDGDGNCKYIAKYSGDSWSGMDNGMNVSVLSIAIIGTVVYAGGYFDSAGTTCTTGCNGIAKWTPSGGSGSWSALGSGTQGLYPYVYAIVPSGTDLYVGGAVHQCDWLHKRHRNRLRLYRQI